MREARGPHSWWENSVPRQWLRGRNVCQVKEFSDAKWYSSDSIYDKNTCPEKWEWRNSISFYPFISFVFQAELWSFFDQNVAHTAELASTGPLESEAWTAPFGKCKTNILQGTRCACLGAALTVGSQCWVERVFKCDLLYKPEKPLHNVSVNHTHSVSRYQRLWRMHCLGWSRKKWSSVPSRWTN